MKRRDWDKLDDAFTRREWAKVAGDAPYPAEHFQGMRDRVMARHEEELKCEVRRRANEARLYEETERFSAKVALGYVAIAATLIAALYLLK